MTKSLHLMEALHPLAVPFEIEEIPYSKGEIYGTELLKQHGYTFNTTEEKDTHYKIMKSRSDFLHLNDYVSDSVLRYIAEFDYCVNHKMIYLHMYYTAGKVQKSPMEVSECDLYKHSEELLDWIVDNKRLKSLVEHSNIY